MTTITAQDNAAVITPTILHGYETSARSGNVVHELIAPGVIAVTLVGDLPASGTLRFIFDDDTAATAARAILARPTSFVLEDSDRPAVNMTFVRDGSLSATIHDEIRDVWEFDCGFQVIVP